MALASSSPMTCSCSGSNLSVRPSRYEALARRTSVVEMCASSMGALISVECVGPTDELRTRAQQFYALARIASNRVTKLQLICLGDDYLHQADEIRREQIASEIRGETIKRLASSPRVRAV